MRRVISVSLGSSKRDHQVEATIGGQFFSIERRGVDGDLSKARQLIAQLDGHVDAIGLGGIDLYLQAGSRRYVIREAKKLASAAKKTPVVDGSGLKNTLERRVVERLASFGLVNSEQRVLMVCAVDRFGMAEALVKQGCAVTFGDLLFSFGLSLPIYKLSTLEKLARMIAPIACQLPFKLLYPTGGEQEAQNPRFKEHFERADVIAGDFHFIRRYMPSQLKGKIVITNTVTMADLQLLQSRGVHLLITTTPELQGRSFGTNVLEGILVSLAGKRPEEMTSAQYEQWLDTLDLPMRIEDLRPVETTSAQTASTPDEDIDNAETACASTGFIKKLLLEGI